MSSASHHRSPPSQAEPPSPGSLLARVAALAAEAHQGQRRRHGAPYIEHPHAVRTLADDLASAIQLPIDDDVRAAALLHDVGKIASGFGVFPRVFATLWTALRGRERVAAGDRRLARYVRHPAIGGDLLVEADADPLTVSWAREHHLPEREWSVPLEIGRVLKAADDD